MYQVAIVGAGIGATHYKNFKKLPERFLVHTICDLDRSRVDKIITSSSNTMYTDNIDVILDNKAIDIVDICLPPHLHFSFCKKVLEVGKNVICEKPLVASLKEAEDLMFISQKSGKNIFPVFQYRYGLGASQLKALIDNGLSGKPLVASLETHWNRGKKYYDIDWRGTWKGEQGGAILGHSIHIHDWLTMIFGPIASVYAKLATRVNDIEVEDCASLSIEMQNGALVTSSVTLGAANDTSRMRFCFEGLTAESGTSPYSPAEDDWNFIARDPYLQSDIDNCLMNIKKPLSGHAGLFEAIANNLDGQSGQEVTISDGRQSLEFVTAVYCSSRSDQNVSLPLSKSHSLYNSWLP